MNKPDAIRLLGPCTVAVAALLTGVACAPVFSDLQGARLVPPGEIELTPSASTVSVSEEDVGRVQDHFGVQVAAGIVRNVELRGRVERVMIVDSDGEATNVFAAGPKIALVPDRIALFVPVGFAAGGDIESSDTYTLAPTLLGTLPLTEGKLDLNVAGKYLIPLSGEDREGLVAFNVGLAIGPNIERWAIRPEVGFLFDPGEEGHYTQFSLGVSFSTR